MRGPLLSVFASVTTLALCLQAWDTCGVQIREDADALMVVLVLGPVLAVSFGLGLWVFHRLVRLGAKRTGPDSPGLWIADGLLMVILVLTVFGWIGTPADYPTPGCLGNVPPWWPSWIPT